MVLLSMAPAELTYSQLPNGLNGSHNYSSNGTSSYSTSPESTRSKNTRSPSAASGHLYMTNGTSSKTLAQRELSKDTSALTSRLNGTQTERAKRLPRGKSETDLTRHTDDRKERGHGNEENWEVRHGWEEQYNSSAILETLSKVRQNYMRLVYRSGLRTNSMRLYSPISPTILKNAMRQMGSRSSLLRGFQMIGLYETRQKQSRQLLSFA